MNKRIYTAESVTSGHPDKLADLIADSILDECLEQDADSRVAVEVMLTHDKCFIGGEITTKARVDYEFIARATIAQVGYDPRGLDYPASKAYANSFMNAIFSSIPMWTRICFRESPA